MRRRRGLMCLAALGAMLASEAALAKPQSQMTPLEVVNAFDQMAFFDGHPIEASMKYLAPDVIEHDPTTPTGRDGVIAYFKRRKWTKANAMHDKIYQTMSQGDRVMIFHHAWSGDNDKGGMVFADIFRVKNGLIVEHWDVGEPMPTHSVNNNGVF